MNKSDYEAIANIIKNHFVDDDVAFDDLNIRGDYLVLALADYFEKNNPLFKRDKFLKACGVTR